MRNMLLPSMCVNETITRLSVHIIRQWQNRRYIEIVYIIIWCEMFGDMTLCCSACVYRRDEYPSTTQITYGIVAGNYVVGDDPVVRVRIGSSHCRKHRRSNWRELQSDRASRAITNRNVDV